jgi:hypothetical protein
MIGSGGFGAFFRAEVIATSDEIATTIPADRDRSSVRARGVSPLERICASRSQTGGFARTRSRAPLLRVGRRGGGRALRPGRSRVGRLHSRVSRLRATERSPLKSQRHSLAGTPAIGRTVRGPPTTAKARCRRRRDGGQLQCYISLHPSWPPSARSRNAERPNIFQHLQMRARFSNQKFSERDSRFP